MDKATGLEMEQVAEPMPLLEWFTEKYKEFGATLEFVTNKSQEGSQFVKGFGGIGGILRYKVAFEDLGDNDDDDDEFYGSDDDSGMSLPSFSSRRLARADMDRHLRIAIGRMRPAQRHARRWRSWVGCG
jgi:peptide chain release factor subunit 1